MIKVYLDWNIMSSMKRGSFKDLASILNNKEKFLVPYSTSHIGDIFASHSEDPIQRKRIDDDLEYISSITDDNCFFNDGKSKIQLGFSSPKELYEQRIDSQDLFKDFSIDKLFAPFDDVAHEAISPLIKSLKVLLKSMPLDNSFKDAFKNPETASELEKMFPDLKDNLTFEGWFKTFGNMYNRLNESEDYKGLREAVQKIGVNSSHFSQDKDPYDLIQNAYKKFGTSPFQPNNHIDTSKNAPKWFNELSNEYILLDMHGYKQDEVKVDKRNKKTFRNTTDDAFHSAFASRCDFYITNDKKNIEKTKTIFKKFNVETTVLNPDEFVSYYREYLNKHGINEHWDDLFEILETGKDYIKWGNETDVNDKPIGFVGFSKHFFYNFFNKVRICVSDDGGIYYLLTKEHPSDIYFVAYREVENLLKMFIDYYGPDDYNKEYYQSGEMTGLDWEGRTWTFEKFQISIKRLNGWFQLYIYPQNQKKKGFFQRFISLIKKWFRWY